MAVPGLLYVDARFIDSQLTLDAYNKWYDGEHIPHLLSMSGCHAAMRYVDTNEHAKEPYLTLYPLKDVSWVHGAEFGTAIDSTESDVLPQRSVFKSVLFDGRSYTLTDEVEGSGAKTGTAETMILTTFDVKEETSASHDPSQADTKQGSQGPFTSEKLESLASQAGFWQARLYHLHEGQPEEWKKRWEASGGWPARDMLIQEFDGSQSLEQLQISAREFDVAERQQGNIVTSSRVYKLVSAFE